MTVMIGNNTVITCTPAEFVELQRLGVFDEKNNSNDKQPVIQPNKNSEWIDTSHPSCKDFPPYLDCPKHRSQE